MALISVSISKKLNGPNGPFALQADFDLEQGEFGWDKKLGRMPGENRES